MKPVFQVLIFSTVVIFAAGVAYWLTRNGGSPDAGGAILSRPGVAESAAPVGPAYFVDVTEPSGVSLTYRNGDEANHSTILESLGGGIALFDYDGDGLLDVYATGGGHFEGADNSQIIGLPGKLFRNLGDLMFQDVTAEMGLDAVPFYTHGAVAADYDSDGHPDLLITGYGGLALYRNEDGQRFHDVTQAMNLTDTRWATSAGFADLTGNGRVDLFVARYVDWSFTNHPACPPRAGGEGRDVCPPQSFEALPPSLYRNDGDKFTDIWPELGVPATGKGLAVIVADVTEDGRPDVYVANDGTNNSLFLNRGDGVFEETGRPAGVAVDDAGNSNGSMGIDVGDFDGSGRPSLWVTNFEGELPALYRNVGQELFAYHSQVAGIGAIGGTHVGFGTAFLDLDNDGWQDLVFVNGHVVRYPAGAPVLQKPVLLRNIERRGRRVFANVTAQGGDYFEIPALGRGLAVGDLDNDGWQDLVISHSNTPLAVLQNSAATAKDHHWLGVQLRGRNNRPIAGATVTLEVDGRKLTRFAKSGGSYLSSSDPRLLFGLGKAEEVDRIQVRWPWGETQSWDGLDIDTYWELVEDEATAQPVQAIR